MDCTHVINCLLMPTYNMCSSNTIKRCVHLFYMHQGHIMDQGQADITVTPELLSAQTFRQKFVDLKAGLKYTFRVSQTLRGSLFNLVRT